MLALLQSFKWTLCLIVGTSLITFTINTPELHSNFSILRCVLQLFGTKCCTFFLRILLPRYRCFKYHNYNCCIPVLHEDNVQNFLIFCYGYFEDLLSPVTFAKSFDFLTGVVSKIVMIENSLRSKN